MQPKIPHIVNFPEKVLQNIADFCFTEWIWVVFPLQQDEPRRILSQVCSTWRHVVISSPSYWNAIQLAPILAISPIESAPWPSRERSLDALGTFHCPSGSPCTSRMVRPKRVSWTTRLFIVLSFANSSFFATPGCGPSHAQWVKAKYSNSLKGDRFRSWNKSTSPLKPTPTSTAPK